MENNLKMQWLMTDEMMNGKKVRNLSVVEDFLSGMRQMDIAKKHTISKTRVRQILVRMRMFIPLEKRI